MLNTAASILDNVEIGVAIVSWEGYEGSPVVSDSSRESYLHAIILLFSEQGERTWCSLMGSIAGTL